MASMALAPLLCCTQLALIKPCAILLVKFRSSASRLCQLYALAGHCQVRIDICDVEIVDKQFPERGCRGLWLDFVMGLFCGTGQRSFVHATLKDACSFDYAIQFDMMLSIII